MIEFTTQSSFLACFARTWAREWGLIIGDHAPSRELHKQETESFRQTHRHSIHHISEIYNIYFIRHALKLKIKAKLVNIRLRGLLAKNALLALSGPQFFERIQ